MTLGESKQSLDKRAKRVEELRERGRINKQDGKRGKTAYRRVDSDRYQTATLSKDDHVDVIFLRFENTRNKILRRRRGKEKPKGYKSVTPPSSRDELINYTQ